MKNRRNPYQKVGLLSLAMATKDILPDLGMIASKGPAFMMRPASARESVGSALQVNAAKYPHRPFLRFEGQTFTYAEANAVINLYAHVLTSRGVEFGDTVAIISKNHPQMMFAMLATVKLGASAGLLNYHQRGEVLGHSLRILGSKQVIVADNCLDALDSLADADKPDPAITLTVSELIAAAEKARLNDPLAAKNPAITAKIKASTNAFYIFTSGTTGLPKASGMSHHRWLRGMSGFGAMGLRLKGDDVLYCCLPLYHNNAVTVALGSVMVAGACFALGEKFSASRFWDEAIANGATSFIYIGEICRYLLNQPEKPTDKTNKIHSIIGNGLRPEIWMEFKKRFGIDRVVEFYAASESNAAFVNIFNQPGTVGATTFRFAIVEFDNETQQPKRTKSGHVIEVPRGESGLLLTKITRSQPFEGYTDEKATEAKIVRNVREDGDAYMNTGDVVRRQGWRHVAFVDRLGDTFRWKGENVATTEVEGALLESDLIEACIVYGVDIPGADGKAGMAAVVLAEDEKFDGVAIASLVSKRLPAYAAPLYIRLVDSLEHTSTFKSRKVDLRDQGFTDVGADPLYSYVGGSEGYALAYPEYPADVVSAKVPKSH